MPRRPRQPMRSVPGRDFALAIPGFSMAAVLLLAGCHGKPLLTPQQLEGKHLYQVRCAHCHEDNDLGLKRAPPRSPGIFSRPSLPSGAPATDSRGSDCRTCRQGNDAVLCRSVHRRADVRPAGLSPHRIARIVAGGIEILSTLLSARPQPASRYTWDCHGNRENLLP